MLSRGSFFSLGSFGSRFLGKGPSGRRGVCEDQAGASSAKLSTVRSLNDERRFLRGWTGTASLDGGISPIVPRAERLD